MIDSNDSRAREKRRQKIKLEEVIAVVSAILLFSLAASTLHQTSESASQITGAALSRANISALKDAPCNLSLEPGLNLISFFCIASEAPRQQVIENMTELQFIFEYQEGAADPWKTYNPNMPSWAIQDLQTMSRTQGYWINLSNSQQVLISGGLRIPTNVPLSAGWNLVGFPTNVSKLSNQTFSTIDGNFTEVRGYNATTDSFLNFIPPSSGGLIYISTGEGYWINATTSEVWIVD